ncbi:MAG: sensor histidine kinase [Hellea sp.]
MPEGQIGGDLEGVIKTQSLVLRLVRGAVMWALPLLLVTALTLTWLYRNTTYRSFDDPLVSAVTALIATAEVQDGSLSLTREPLDPRYQRALSGRYWLVGFLQDDGIIEPISASRSLLEATLVLPPAAVIQLQTQQGEEIRARTSGPDNDEPLRLVARQVVLPNMNTPVVMVAAADSRAASRSILSFALTALGLMLLISIGLITAVVTQVRSGLKPLFDLRDRVADVREGRSGQVDGVYPTEIQPLATELNSLITHNKDVVERARTHVGNLAHALKTPLAVLQNEAQGSKTTPSDIVSRQTETMKKQVDHHLRRARAAARGQAIGVSTDVTDTLEALARTLSRIYGRKNIDFDIDLMEGLIFRGEKRDLEEMAGNLMDNSCKWTKTALTLRSFVDPEDETSFIVTVSDDGPGMAEDQYVEALKRGARLDEATPGSGFGLAIVDDLAKAYKGSVRLGKSDLGGLKVALTLPRRL